MNKQSLLKPAIIVIISLLLLSSVLAEQNDLSSRDESPTDYHHIEDIASLRSIILNRISSFFSPPVTVFCISMIPIFELRGSIPVGINHFGLNPVLVFFISIAGNMVPVFLILLFLGWVTKIFYKIPILRRFLEYLFRRTHSRSKVVEKYQEIGLVIFVAIPLPITGAWTGSLAAYLFGLQFWKSVFFIFCGVVIAGIVVTTLSLLGWTGAIIALTVLILFFLRKAVTLIKINRKSEH